MSARRLVIGGREWRVLPSGWITQYDADEFGLIFVTGFSDEREARFVRYAPMGTRAREQSLAELSDADLERLFAMSQPSETAPEAGYHR